MILEPWQIEQPILRELVVGLSSNLNVQKSKASLVSWAIKYRGSIIKSCLCKLDGEEFLRSDAAALSRLFRNCCWSWKKKVDKVFDCVESLVPFPRYEF